MHSSEHCGEGSAQEQVFGELSEELSKKKTEPVRCIS